MSRNSIKIIFISFLFVIYSIFLPPRSFAYRVSGLVEFEYRIHDLKTGNGPTHTDTSFIQNYSVALQSYLSDPRFLTYNVGVGYNVINQHNTSIDKTGGLSYNVNLNFFPTMKVSWDLFGSKQTQNIQDAITHDNFDVKNTIYGGSLNLKLRSMVGGNGNLNTNNNGNNENNSNNTGNAFRNVLPWITPDIGVRFTSMDRLSESLLTPLHEKRDDTGVDLAFSGRSSSMLVTGNKETYENKLTGGTYDAENAGINYNAGISAKGTLRIIGNTSDLKTESITGFNNTEDRKNNLSALLQYTGDLKQNYQYVYSSDTTPTITNTAQAATATVYKDITSGLSLKGGVTYNDTEFKAKALGTSSYRVNSGNVLAGFLYHAQYRPDFMGPFGVTTNYDFSYGRSKTTNTTTSASGSGAYTANSLFVTLDSQGWDRDYAGISYSFDNKRDKSLLDVDNKTQKVVLRLRTTRIPRTTVDGVIDFTKQEASSKDPTGGYLTGLIPGTFNNGRSTLYTLTVDHILAYYLRLGAGISRTDQQTNQLSLLTIQPANRISQEFETDYLKANFNWMFTRRLTYDAEVRDEWRRTFAGITGAPQDRLQTYYVNMNLRYLLRQILVTLTYNFRQDNPDHGGKRIEQDYFIKVSRSF